MLRLGIVDFDSSHSIEFTRRFNHVGVAPEQCVDGARVVAGCPGTFVIAPERIDEFRPQVAACGVRLVAAPEELMGSVDGVLILSLCGSAHLQHARLFLENGVPVFIDKPLACSTEHAREIARLAAEHNTLAWSASGMRYSEDILRLKARMDSHGRVNGLVSHGPGWRIEGNPGLLHYGIHAVEAAYAMAGPGCIEVSCRSGEAGDDVSGVWQDGRMVTIRTLRQGATAYGLLAFCQHAVVHSPVSAKFAYRNLCRAIVEGFRSGAPPVPLEESVEVVRFILAALESERAGGRPVRLAEAVRP